MRSKVGFVGIWNRPESPLPWSGVPYRTMEALRSMDAFGGYLDATPPRPSLRAWRRVRRAARLPESQWFLDTVPQASLRASNLFRRVVFSGRADAWVVPAMGLGRPVRGRVASLSEMSPHQLRSLDIDLARTFWPAIEPKQVRRLARQQEELHRRATVCVVASHWAGDSLVRDLGIDPARVCVVGYGINLEMDPPEDRDWSSPRFLFCGLQWERKNGERVVRAFTRLREQFPHATLDLVGDHPHIDVPGVTTHGRRLIHDPDDRELIVELHRRSTCFVLPSQIEPFGIVHVEAGRAGLPSIGTTNGGTVDSIGDGGLRVDPLDDGAIHAAMVRMSDPDEARRRGAAAQRRAGQFTWRKTAERIVRALSRPGEDVADLAEPL